MPSAAPRESVLIITYLFPPSGGVGVPRFVSYARYLPQHGCDVSILTVRKPATPTYDPELAKQVPPETHVFRAFNPEVPYALRDRIWKGIISGGKSEKSGDAATGNWKRLPKELIQRVFNPDVQVVWTPFAIRAMRRIVASRGITTVLVNLPPYSCLRIAAAVKRYFPNVKLILDFRDEWIDNYLRMFDSAANRRKLDLAYRLEREAVEPADYVAAVTRSQLQQIRQRYPSQPDGKFLYVPNGYDPDLYRGFVRRPHSPGKVIVTYFGTVYDNDAYRPVADYLDALERLPENVRNNIETRFIGRIAKEAEYFFEGRTSPIRRLGFMSRGDGLTYLAESDYHLMPAGNPTTHAGKLFDYLATGIPILALGSEQSEIAQVLRETRSGLCADPKAPAALQEMVLAAYQRAMGGEPPAEPDRDAIRFYEWPRLVERMARLARLGAYRFSNSAGVQ